MRRHADEQSADGEQPRFLRMRMSFPLEHLLTHHCQAMRQAITSVALILRRSHPPSLSSHPSNGTTSRPRRVPSRSSGYRRARSSRAAADRPPRGPNLDSRFAAAICWGEIPRALSAATLSGSSSGMPSVRRIISSCRAVSSFFFSSSSSGGGGGIGGVGRG